MGRVVSALVHEVLAKGDDDTHARIMTGFVVAVTKGSCADGRFNLEKNVAKLALTGNSEMRQVASSPLLKSYKQRQAQDMMIDNGCTAICRAQVIQQKEDINLRRIRAAEKRGAEAVLIPVTVERDFSLPFTEGKRNEKHKDCFLELISGKESRPRPRTTKISEKRMTHPVAFICSNTHCRPGKI